MLGWAGASEKEHGDAEGQVGGTLPRPSFRVTPRFARNHCPMQAAGLRMIQSDLGIKFYVNVLPVLGYSIIFYFSLSIISRRGQVVPS